MISHSINVSKTLICIRIEFKNWSQRTEVEVGKACRVSEEKWSEQVELRSGDGKYSESKE